MKHDFATRLNPTETAVRIASGREALCIALKIPTARASVENRVDFGGAFTSSDGDYDEFIVTTNGTADLTPADKSRFHQLGCILASSSGRIAILTKRHADYDTRWFKIDMSTPQCCTAFFIAGLGIALAAGAVWM